MLDIPQTEDQRRECMDFIMSAGQALLENGGEVFRVQQTMYMMASALHLKDMNIYVLSNGIFASCGTAEVSAIHHVPQCEIHLGRVAEINRLSRELTQGQINSLSEAQNRLAEIKAMPASPVQVQIIASGIGAACFAVLFGGSLADGAVAAAAGWLLACFLELSTKFIIYRPLFGKLAGSAVATAFCLAVSVLIPSIHSACATIGVLLVLTPGVTFTNGIRDLVHGDYLSGNIRLSDAVLQAGSMACGVGLVYWFFGLLGVAV